MNKILIIQRRQYGTHVDTYYYSKILSKDRQVNYICFDTGIKKIEDNGVVVHYVNVRKYSFLKFIYDSLRLVHKENFQTIFINYFPGCSVIKLLSSKKNWILDIRTGNTSTSPKKRFLMDSLLKFEVKFFENVTVISDSLGKKLNLKNYFVLPLGAKCHGGEQKEFSSMHLIYVGIIRLSFHKIVEGFALFYKKYKDKMPLSFTIIGYGKNEIVNEMKNTIVRNQLQDVVKFLGKIEHKDLGPYFHKANIGISYIPMRDYFEFQPPSKTYEYILSGLPCLATNTYENKKIIDKVNGVLCDDEAESVFNGLEEMMQNLDKYDSQLIRKSLAFYDIENIAENVLKPYIAQIEAKKSK